MLYYIIEILEFFLVIFSDFFFDFFDFFDILMFFGILLVIDLRGKVSFMIWCCVLLGLVVEMWVLRFF